MTSHNTHLAADQEPGTTHTLLEPTPGTGLVQRTVLPGGLRIITEELPDRRSVAFAIGTTTSSRDEDPADAGSSHFLEHLLYKGTTTRSASEISRAMESAGARHNAVTWLDGVCYHAQVVDTGLPTVVDVITDMAHNALLDPVEVDREREVVVHEIGQMYDRPERLLQDLMLNTLHHGHAMGQSNLGTPEGIRAMPLERLRAQYERAYAPCNLIVLAAGAVDHDQLVSQVAAAFAPKLKAAGNACPRRPRPATSDVPNHSGTRIHYRGTDRAHMMLGVQGLPRTHQDLPVLDVIQNAFTGGQASRLFRNLREDRGLVYRMRRITYSWDDAGMAGCLTACDPAKLTEVHDLITAQFAALAKEGLTQEEVSRGKALAAADLVNDGETVMDRLLVRYGQELQQPRHQSLADLLDRIEQVTSDDVARVAEEIYGQPLSTAVVGPVDQDMRPC